MLTHFLKQLERRHPIDGILSECRNLFHLGPDGRKCFSDTSFSDLLEFLNTGETSYQGVAVQAAVRWAGAAQRVKLRKALLKRGFLTSSCLWAYRQARGNGEELFQEYPSPDMAFMQVLLLKESDPAKSVPFLIERFLSRRELPEEVRAASRLCILRLLDSCSSSEQVKSLQCRYPGVEILNQWRPGIPGAKSDVTGPETAGSVDFSHLVRSVHDLKEFSSLTRMVYLASLFYVPLSESEWSSLRLGRTDELSFRRLRSAGILESRDEGLVLSAEAVKQSLVRKFLYDSYSLARDSVHRLKAERTKEDRERKVRNSELDRQALEMISDGIICVDRTGLVYYLNPAAESMLTGNKELKERLFGPGSLEEAFRKYSRDTVLSRITAGILSEGDSGQIFGDRADIRADGRRFEVRLGPQVILLRDTTDQSLIDEEVGKLFRHELKAALDVMGLGLQTVRGLTKENRGAEALECLDQIESKRLELSKMLEERIDFIRLHSDAFTVRPETVNLNLVVDRSVVSYRDAAASKGITVKSNHLHVPALLVRGEERYLVKAVDNIFRNAVKFSNKGGTVSVSLHQSGLQALLRIEDNGPGIPPQHLGRIFQLGFTTGGSGRGLYLAKRILSAHGGRIEVKSRSGEGASFTVSLPLVTEA